MSATREPQTIVDLRIILDEWCHTASTQHGLNDSIISVNPSTFLLSFSSSDRTTDSREAPFKFQPGVTCDRTTKKKKNNKKKKKAR